VRGCPIFAVLDSDWNTDIDNAAHAARPLAFIGTATVATHIVGRRVSGLVERARIAKRGVQTGEVPRVEKTIEIDSENTDVVAAWWIKLPKS